LRQDWGDAPDVSTFYGRDGELLDLEQWIKSDRSRLVIILGRDGVGKTALCAKVAEKIQEHFDYVIWRSLRNASSIQEILTVLIEFLSHKQEINQAEGTPPFKRRSPFDLPESIDEKIYLLLNYLRFFRCLIVLDNTD
jgi:AAA+ ATPase superfamily predicted ATPase